MTEPLPDPAVVAALQAATEIAIIPHVLPDVDALGSAEGLCRILRACGHTTFVHAPDVPEIFSWALAPELRRTQPPEAGVVRIGIDTARPDRLQIEGPVAANIDHHEDNPGFGQTNWVAVAPSCSCLLLPLARAMGVEVDADTATALYTGLVGDTEGFRVHAVPEAFEWAARLVALGADAETVGERFHHRSPGFWSYLAAVEGAGFELPGTPVVRVVPIPGDYPERFRLLPYENALLPSHLAPPKDGILAILQEGRSGIRFRLRSRGVDVLPLAHALGGGGHPGAAGVQLVGATLAEAQARLQTAWAAVH